MILNVEEVEQFFKRIAIKRDGTAGTVIFTNGNDRYISTLIMNLIKSYKVVSTNPVEIGVFCSDEKAYKTALDLGMTTCYVNIPALGIDEAYNSAGAGSELYLRLCFVKILLIKYALQLGYDVLYIDPDMAFNKDCLGELISISTELVFAKLIRLHNFVFVNSNIMRVYPTTETIKIFDFVVSKDLQRYLDMLPEVGDETFLKDQLLKQPNIGQSLNTNEYPSGADSKNVPPERIKMYHANCIVGLENKVEYLKRNNVWYLK
jgi:hypothetical protein